MGIVEWGPSQQAPPSRERLCEERVSRVSSGPDGKAFQAECRISSPWGRDSGNIWERLWVSPQSLSREAHSLRGLLPDTYMSRTPHPKE